MQKESRAIAIFGTLGALFVAGVLVLPKLVEGASGVEALPTAPKSPSPELVTPNQPRPQTVPRLFGAPSLSKTQIAFAFAGEIWTVPREGGTARRLLRGAPDGGAYDVAAGVVPEQVVDRADTEDLLERPGGFGSDDVIEAVAQRHHGYSTPIRSAAPRGPGREMAG